MVVQKNLSVTINFYKTLLRLAVITWNKKHLSKQVVPMTITLEKTLFKIATF